MEAASAGSLAKSAASSPVQSNAKGSGIVCSHRCHGLRLISLRAARMAALVAPPSSSQAAHQADAAPAVELALHALDCFTQVSDVPV
jgi:hypothetical protein